MSCAHFPIREGDTRLIARGTSLRMSNAKIISVVNAAVRVERTEAKADIAALLNATQDELSALEFQLDGLTQRVRKLEEGVPH